MSWLTRLTYFFAATPCPPEKPERGPSPMQFDPSDVNAQCDICEAPMTSFGPVPPDFMLTNAVSLQFKCGSRWQSEDPKDLYWVEQNHCKQATRLLREMRS